jgi:hypothetical protein
MRTLASHRLSLRSRPIRPCHRPYSTAITDEASPFALRSTRNRLRRAMRRGAPSTVVSPCRCLVTAVVRPSRQCPSVCSAELSYCGSTRWRLTGGACGERPSGRASLRRPGMPGRRPCRPSPARVHRWVSTHPVPTSGVRSSNRPVSSRPVSSRPVSGQLVPSSGVQPSGVRSSGVRPSARSPPRLCQPGGALGSHRGGGQP